MDPDNKEIAAARFGAAVNTMARLRGPDGCPWDREQDFESVRRYTLEETYEVFDAIERQDWSGLKEELGDLLLQVLFYAQMASERRYFTISDVLEGLNRKLVRRHPHVFGDEAAAAAGNGAAATMPTRNIDSAQVLRNWEAIKATESLTKATENLTRERTETDSAALQTPSVLASIPRSLPALMEAQKLGSRASKCNFDWPDEQGLFAKLEEETTELHAAIAKGDLTDREEEVGDLLFTIANLARHLEVDSEMALRRTNGKFRTRFAAMETASRIPLEQLSATELEELWCRAKERERTSENEHA